MARSVDPLRLGIQLQSRGRYGHRFVPHIPFSFSFSSEAAQADSAEDNIEDDVVMMISAINTVEGVEKKSKKWDDDQNKVLGELGVLNNVDFMFRNFILPPGLLNWRIS